MPVKMQPTSIIKTRLGINAGGSVQKFLTDTCYNHMDKYVPMDSGTLSRIVTVEIGRITYEMPYAHYMYQGVTKDGKPFNYSKDKHPYAGDHWDKRMVTAEMQEIEKEVQNYIGGKQ